VRCYFLSGGHIVEIELLTDLSYEEAVARAHELLLERGPLIEGFEVWHRDRVLFRYDRQARKEFATSKNGSSG
jgi:hypothetical protein